MEQNKWMEELLDKDMIKEFLKINPLAFLRFTNLQSEQIKKLLLARDNEIKEMVSKLKEEWVGISDAEEALDDIINKIENK